MSTKGARYVQIDKGQRQVTSPEKRGKQSSEKVSSEKVGLLTGHETEQSQAGSKQKEVEMTTAESWGKERSISQKKQQKSSLSSKTPSPPSVEAQPEEAVAFAKTSRRLQSYSSIDGEGDGSSKEDKAASSPAVQPATKSEDTKAEAKAPRVAPPRPLLPQTTQRGTQLIIVLDSKPKQKPCAYNMPDLYFCRALMTCLFCFCPLGVLALLKSFQAWGYYKRDNIANSKKSASEAKELANKSIFFCIVLCSLVGFTLALAGGIVILLLKTLEIF